MRLGRINGRMEAIECNCLIPGIAEDGGERGRFVSTENLSRRTLHFGVAGLSVLLAKLSAFYVLPPNDKLVMERAQGKCVTWLSRFNGYIEVKANPKRR